MGKGVKFNWGKEQQESYEAVIMALESSGALYPFRADLETRHVADASPSGIASSIYMITKERQEETWRPVNHFSQSLTVTEQQYPQIDRESLAQVWGMGQHRYYLIGRHFKTITDHRPLLAFYNNKKKATPRIEKHLIKTQDLNYTMEFMEGKKNPSDWYSRHPEDISNWSERQLEKHNVDTGKELQMNRVLAVRKLDKFLHETGIDETPRYSDKDIITFGLDDKEYTVSRKKVEKGHVDRIDGEYKAVSKELSVCDSLLLRDGKFVIPKGDGSMRRNLMKVAHEGHPGIGQIKSILRGVVFWPGMTGDIEDEYRSCLACQATKEGRHHRDHLTPSAPPEKVWSTLGSDHWGPIPDGTGRHVLLVQDYLTKYPEAIVVKGTSAESNIPILEEIFGRHGYPDLSRNRQRTAMEWDRQSHHEEVFKMGRQHSSTH